ncbi:hypothetical protein A9Q99_06455 [Gammaproteobacteria bacterium 45_16_T64]|nr:hypothetical protein A9Q99_06455 [Gammaproteobacteria bacterium 45_16_T64]
MRTISQKYSRFIRPLRKISLITTMVASVSLLPGCASEDAEAPALLSEGESSQGRVDFFEALRHGSYDDVDDIIITLTEESSAGDPRSQAVLGFAHSWKLAEYRRDPTDPNITQHAQLAIDAFHGAIKEIPDDARLLGFRGSFRQAQGKIDDNSLLTALGWFDEVNAAKRWPAWGLFTKAYGLITFEPEESLYKQGIDFMWENLDVCAGVPVDKDSFNLQDYPQLGQPYSDPRLDRACNNTAVAPYNLEGFFLYFGDMYAKASNLEKASVMYNAALELDPGSWPYADVANTRLERLEELPTLFNLERASSELVSADDINLFQGPISCVSCHQMADH